MSSLGHMLTDIYLGSSYSLLGWAVGEQIMNCFLPKPAKPEICPKRRVQNPYSMADPGDTQERQLIEQ